MGKVITDKTVGRVWLINQGGESVGYLVITISYRLEYRGNYAFLDELYIRADKRRQGIGTAALAYLKVSCKALNVNCLQLEVKQDNPEAIALYRKIGFRQQPRQVLTITL